MKRLFGLTIIGWLNFIIMQWLGLRLWYEPDSSSGRIKRLGIYFPVLPLSGWWSDYIPKRK